MMIGEKMSLLNKFCADQISLGKIWRKLSTESIYYVIQTVDRQIYDAYPEFLRSRYDSSQKEHLINGNSAAPKLGRVIFSNMRFNKLYCYGLLRAYVNIAGSIRRAIWKIKC